MSEIQDLPDRVVLLVDGPTGPRIDVVAHEEPLEIRVGALPLAVVLRTPGRDLDLAVGFLLTEGLVADPAEILSVAPCRDDGGAPVPNVVRVIAPGADPKALEAARRQIYASSSCGICGKASIEAIRLLCPPRPPSLPVRASVIAALPDRLRSRQPLFAACGGVHGVGRASPDGELLDVAEDVGRHNAADKVIGAAARAGRWPLHGEILVVSGRASFELVQKAAMAGMAALVAVSAPTSMAVEHARAVGLTLVGFARGASWNLYAGPPPEDDHG